MIRSKVVSAFAALAVVLSASGCTGSSASTESGDYLKIGSLGGIESPNPMLGDSGDARAAYGYIYPKLTQDGESGSGIAGDFATSWETKDDGRTWVFHTLPDAHWSDGEPMTARDAAWWFSTLIRFKNGPTAVPAYSMGNMEKAVATDDETLVVTYESRDMQVPSRLTTIPILPQHVWEPAVGKDGAGLKTFDNVPTVAGGPFVMTKWVKDDIALFERNPSYYGPKPKIERFGVKAFANEDALVQAVKSRAVDTARINSSSIPAFAHDSSVEVVQEPGLRMDWMVLNTNEKKTDHPELSEPTVGEALSHSIDREQFVDIVFGGAAQAGSTYISPAMGPYNDASGVKPDAYDPELANALLDDAGYERGPDGVRTANGHDMTYTVLAISSNNPQLSRQSELLAQAAEKVGIELTVKPMDIGAWASAMAGPDEKWLDWDIALYAPEAAGGDPGYFTPQFLCSNFVAEGGLNFSSYCDKRFDELNEEQAAETDEDARIETLARMQTLVHGAYPVIVLDYRDMVEVWNDSWEGYIPTAAGSYNERSKWTLLNVH